MSENREGYQDPYASEDIKHMREMYDNVVHSLIKLMKTEIIVRILTKRLQGLPPSFLQELSITERSASYVEIMICDPFIKDGDVYYNAYAKDLDTSKIKSPFEMIGATHGVLSQSDIIHVLNEAEVTTND